jgi:type I site-specific restriction-modification system R (restriction) subunit
VKIIFPKQFFDIEFDIKMFFKKEEALDIAKEVKRATEKELKDIHECIQEAKKTNQEHLAYFPEKLKKIYEEIVRHCDIVIEFKTDVETFSPTFELLYAIHLYKANKNVMRDLRKLMGKSD